MDAFRIQGGHRLSGRIAVDGSKNACLPLMAAALLTDQPVTLRGVPALADIENMAGLLGVLGVAVDGRHGTITLRSTDPTLVHAPYKIVSTMRASICVLGALVARRGRARVAMPGGCSFGARPVDLHLRGLEALGAKFDLCSGDIVAEADRLTGATVFLGGPFGSTVLGTANVMCAATLARGRTVIESAACEPEVYDLAVMLNSMGARISGAGTPRVVIDGVDELGPADHTVMPDRIVACTWAIATAVTNGEVTLNDFPLLKPVMLTTQPYPGFPTDLQAQMMALLCLAQGNSIITEKIYPERFMHVAELTRMGAQIFRQGPTVMVQGMPRLVAAPVMASDLRGSACLVLAGLAAEGTTTVSRVYHLDRGYARMEETLNALGAKIERFDARDLQEQPAPVVTVPSRAPLVEMYQ
jgi:UDP-N-acetylglucosamine 1-carboxyvinyltransferase